MLNELLIAFGILTICVFLHVGGLIVMAEWLSNKRSRIASRTSLIRTFSILLRVFFGIIILHISESMIWSVFYYVRGLFDGFETSVYFSLVTYATIGYGDVVLPEKWRLLAAVEGLTGILLSGLSTAFLFVVLTGILDLRREKRERKKEALKANSE